MDFGQRLVNYNITDVTKHILKPQVDFALSFYNYIFLGDPLILAITFQKAKTNMKCDKLKNIYCIGHILGKEALNLQYGLYIIWFFHAAYGIS